MLQVCREVSLASLKLYLVLSLSKAFPFFLCSPGKFFMINRLSMTFGLPFHVGHVATSCSMVKQAVCCVDVITGIPRRLTFVRLATRRA
jgi:hypothetical protein